MSKSLIHILLIVGLCACLGAGIAAADETDRIDRITAAVSMQSGACRDTFTGEAATTESASLEYRHESENFSVLARGLKSPAGSNCADDAFSYRGEIERRFAGPRGFYGFARLGAVQHTQTGIFRHVSDGLVIFANQTDGSPGYTVAAGTGRCVADGAICFEAAYNVAPNDYWRNGRAWTGTSGVVNASFARDLLGGRLEATVEAEGPRLDTLVTGQAVTWTREVGSRFGISLGWRRTAGLSKLRSPFSDSIVRDGRTYFLGATDDSVSTVEFGFSARL